MTSKQPSPPPFVEISKKYDNNPFFIATTGISMVFKYAKNIGVFLLVLSVLLTISQFIPSSPTDTSVDRSVDSYLQSISTSELATVVIAVVMIGLAIFVLSIMLNGIVGYTAARTSQGKSTTLKQAFNAVLERFGSYLWLSILVGVKVFLWSLLFIIPGVIMAVRYSLSSAVFFDERNSLKGGDAIKRSSELVKGSWLTTFAAQSLFNIITLGWISFVVSVSTQSALYKQYTDAAASGADKPRAHWLSWVTMLLLFTLFIAIALLFIILVATFNAIGFSER